MKFNFKILKRSKKGNVIESYNDELVIDVLTIGQISNTIKWYKQHKEHINKMVADTEKAYPPSLIEDKNNPMLWKAEYWKWFLLKFGILR
jgi:hypothetical protein